jgi:hypothetical protein
MRITKTHEFHTIKIGEFCDKLSDLNKKCSPKLFGITVCRHKL